MPDEFKDWTYIICTLIQTALAVIALIVVNCYWRIKDRRDSDARKHKEEREKHERLDREEREKHERLDREEREKIADLFIREYNAIEYKCENMEKILSSLQNTPIIMSEHRTVFSLDVLRYMCQPDHRNDFNNKELESFCVDVDKIVKLFRNFRVNLLPPALRRQCPENIKEELGPSIIKIGSYVFPFVSSTKQNTISEVLSYFGDETSSNVTDIGKLHEEIPYVNNFQLKDGKIAFNTTSMVRLNSHIIGIANLLEEKKITSRYIEDISKYLITFWDSCSTTSSSASLPNLDFLDSTNVLHLMRMTLDKQCRSTFQPDDASEKMIADLENLHRVLNLNVLRDLTVQRTCERFIEDLAERLGGLKKFQELLQQKATAEFLKKLSDDCDGFLAKMIDCLK